MREIAIGRGGAVRPIGARGREFRAREAGTAVEAELASVEVTRESVRKADRQARTYVRARIESARPPAVGWKRCDTWRFRNDSESGVFGERARQMRHGGEVRV